MQNGAGPALGVTGATWVQVLAADGDVSVGGTLTAQADAQVAGGLTVAGAAALNGGIAAPGPVGMLGPYQPVAVNPTSPPATDVVTAGTDGLVIATATAPLLLVAAWQGTLSGVVNGVTVTQAVAGMPAFQQAAEPVSSSIFFPVQKGAAWQVQYAWANLTMEFTAPTLTVYWIPFGTAQGT